MRCSTTGLMISLLRTVNDSPINLSSQNETENTHASTTLVDLVSDGYITKSANKITDNYYIIKYSITESGKDLLTRLITLRDL